MPTPERPHAVANRPQRPADLTDHRAVLVALELAQARPQLERRMNPVRIGSGGSEAPSRQRPARDPATVFGLRQGLDQSFDGRRVDSPRSAVDEEAKVAA